MWPRKACYCNTKHERVPAVSVILHNKECQVKWGAVIEEYCDRGLIRSLQKLLSPSYVYWPGLKSRGVLKGALCPLWNHPFAIKKLRRRVLTLSLLRFSVRSSILSIKSAITLSVFHSLSTSYKPLPFISLYLPLLHDFWYLSHFSILEPPDKSHNIPQWNPHVLLSLLSW